MAKIIEPQNEAQDGNLASTSPFTKPILIFSLTESLCSSFVIATYSLIYAFLTSKSHQKAAEALKKAAKDTVVLKDDVTTADQPSLEVIVKEWKELKAKAYVLYLPVLSSVFVLVEDEVTS